MGGSTGTLQFISIEYAEVGIDFADGSTGTLHDAHIQYAGTGVSIGESTASVLDSTIELSSSFGVRLLGDPPLGGDDPGRFTGNTITAGSSYPVFAHVDRASLLSGTTSYTGNATDKLYLYTDEHRIEASALNQELTLQALDVPYRSTSDLYFGGDTAPTLTLDPGVELQFKSGGGLHNIDDGLHIMDQGVLSAMGTADDPIRFTSDEAPPPPGYDWAGIEFEDGSTGTLQHAHIEYAQTGVIIRSSTASILDTTIEYSSSYGVRMNAGAPPGGDLPSRFTGNTITAGNTNPIYVDLSRANLLDQSNDLYGNADDRVYLYTSSFDTVGEALGTDIRLQWPYMPYEVSGSVYVGQPTSHATLTIDEGAELQFGSSRGLYIADGGNLYAVGTGSFPVVFTSNATVPSAGGWYGIDFLTGSSGAISYADIGYANIGVDVYDGSPWIGSSHIHDHSTYGVSVRAGATASLTGNSYSDNPVDVNYE